jgi:hypothetical protein
MHPAAIPLLGFGFLVHLHPFSLDQGTVLYTCAFIFTGTYILPAFISLLLKQMGLITSLRMEEASARRWPFIIGFLFYLFTAVYLKSFPIPQETGRFVMGAAVSIGILTVLLPYTKASAHMAGMGGLLALLIYVSDVYAVDLFPYLISLILLSGALGSARLKLEAHTSIEIIVGFASGLGGTLFALHQF